MVADYSYDYLDRMTRYRSFVTNGSTSTKDDASDYEYDALDRVLEQTQSHGASGSPRTTLMTYLGLDEYIVLTGRRAVPHHPAMVRLGSSMAMPGRPRSGRS